MPFSIIRDEITKMNVNAIVIQTNTNLFGLVGVDGAIHNIEGAQLEKQTDKIGNLSPGECALTKASKLPCDYIIHTVGPIWNNGESGEETVLKNCYMNVLDLAKEKGIESIAFPLLSSGTYGFPKDVALNIAIKTIGEFLLFNEMTIYLVVFDKQSYQISKKLYTSIKSYIDDNYVDGNTFQERTLRDEAEYDYKNIYREAIPPTFRKREKKDINESMKSLDDVVRNLDETFSQMLLRLIDERGLKDPEVYKRANVTKQTFSKIRNNTQYNPTKQTAIAFAIALNLSLDETKDLLLKSGYALSNSSRFDVIISYFLENKNYDIYEINSVLFAYDENLLGL